MSKRQFASVAEMELYAACESVVKGDKEAARTCRFAMKLSDMLWSNRENQKMEALEMLAKVDPLPGLCPQTTEKVR